MATTIWRGYITFGLISIPVRLFRAARAEKISFRKLYRAHPGERAESEPESDTDTDTEEEEERQPSLLRARFGGPPQQVAKTISMPSSVPAPEPVLAPIQQVSVRRGTDDVIAPTSLVKGYEYEKNRFVVIDPEELKSIAPKTGTEMEILEFIRLDEIDPIYFETSYYVKPEDAGQKAYALLYRSLQLTGLVAIARFAMHSREHVIVVRPGKGGLISHTMFFYSEVRAEEEFRADINDLKPKELELAKMLIHSLEAPFEPEKYHDTYREKLEAMLEAKVQGKATATLASPPKRERVIDITEALQKSLANLKKPPQPSEQLAEKSEVKKAVKSARRK